MRISALHTERSRAASARSAALRRYAIVLEGVVRGLAIFDWRPASDYPALLMVLGQVPLEGQFPHCPLPMEGNGAAT